MASQTMGNWQCVKTLKGHTAKVNSVAIHPNNKTLVSGSNDRQVNLWNLQTGKCLYIFSGQAEAVLSVAIIAIHPDGKIVASSSQEGIIKLWNFQTGALLATISGFSPLVFSLDGTMLISGDQGGTIKIWQLDSSDNLPLIGEWWEILGVEPKTHPKDVKLAYLRLAKLYHPDINSSVSAKTAMQAVNQAYQKFQQQLKTHKTHN
ncbi:MULTISPECIES: DnaJ domain-containing protein [Nostocales]|uniref:J domain-containing protein n=2 Tax=Dolichospermum TaxID=748770 RepID=A0A480A891_9CYAN|nr:MULTISPECIES: DnaJ domain-containing protein [Nostocales]GCL41290.1 hypothetical protein NIES80_09850 [Dolichospermum planctonicum]